MIVVDASAVLEVLLVTPGSARVTERLLAPGETRHAPHLLDLEVAQALRRCCLVGELGAERGRQALEDLALPFTRNSFRANVIRHPPHHRNPGVRILHT